MLEFKTNFEKVIKDLQSRKSKLAGAARQGMQQGMRHFEGQMIRKYYSGRGEVSAGLNRQTGTLARAWRVTLQMAGRGGLNTAVKLANSQIYARIHEFGGVIRPKKGKFLVFQVRTAKYTKAGKRRGYRDQLIFAKQVTIPRRTYVLPSFKESGRQIIARSVMQNINRALKEGI